MTKLFSPKNIIFSFGIFFAFVLIPQTSFADVLLPGNISTCGELASAGIYTITQTVGSIGETCFTITSDGVEISDNNLGYSINGNIVADAISQTDQNGHSFSISGSISIGTSANVSILGDGSGLIGTISFNDSSYLADGAQVSGRAVFNDSSYSVSGSSISGDAFFASTATEASTVLGVVYKARNVSSNGFIFVWTDTTGNHDFGNNLNYRVAGEVPSSTPNEGDIIIIDVSPSLNPSAGNVVADDVVFYGDISNFSTINGRAIFNDSSQNGEGAAGVINGSAVFNDYSYNAGGSEINGYAIFNDSSANVGTVNGQAYFAASVNSSYYGTVTGNSHVARNFNSNGFVYIWESPTGDFSYDTLGNYWVKGSAYANELPQAGDIVIMSSLDGNTYNCSSGTVNADFISFYNSLQNNASCIVGGNAEFYDTSSNNGTVTGDSSFYENSYNNGTVINATFYDVPNNMGIISGNVTFASSTFTDFSLGGTVGGTVTFSSASPVAFEMVTYDWSYDASNWVFTTPNPTWTFRNNTVLTANLPNGAAATFYDNSYTNKNLDSPVFYDSSHDNAGANVMGTFYDTSYNSYGGNSAIFYDSSYNVGYINNSAVFNDSSYNLGTVAGTATFNDFSYPDGSSTLTNVIFSTSTFANFRFGSNGSTINGSITFSSETPVEFNVNNSTWIFDSSSWIFSGGTPTWIFSDGGSLGASVLYGNAIFNSNNSFVSGGNSHITGDVTINSTYLSGGTAPTNGILEINNSQWYLDVDGTIYGSDEEEITEFIFNGSATNNNTVPVNATFNDSAINNGNIMGNANVYSPVIRPLGGSVLGIITYFNYPGFYFNDKDTGDGNWNNALNWWTDSNFTIPAGIVPSTGDEVHIYSDLDQDTSSSASAGTITFENGAKNKIAITVGTLATFNGTSTNTLTGAITGTTTFVGNLTDNLGTVVGTLTRLFTTAVTTTRNFLIEGNRNNWIIIAQGVIVDISGAVYDVASNIFKALNNGSFSFGSNTQPTSQLTVSSPTTGTVTKWMPSIDWDNSETCEYSFDNWATTETADCAESGSDIPKPSAGSNILNLRSINANDSIVEKNISFTYDNTVATYTLCGDDVMDEASRPYYYLNSNLTANCTATVDTELRGTNYILTGNVTTSGNDIILRNISIDGTITSTGGNISVYDSTTNSIVASGASNGSGNGEDGGDIIIDTSTTGSITTNGGDGSVDGGDGGNAITTNSIGSPITTVITSNGGNSTSCGDGGNAGDISLTDSTYGTPVNNAGVGENLGCPLETHTGGSRRSPTVSGTHSSQTSNNSNTNTNSSSQSGSSFIRQILNRLNLSTLQPFTPFNSNFIPQNVGSTLIPNPLGNLQILSPLKLLQIPINFMKNISNFLFKPIPNAITNSVSGVPQLAKYMASVGVNDNLGTNNVSLRIPSDENIPPGLFIIKQGTTTLPIYAIRDNNIGGLGELVKVPPNQVINVSLIPLSLGQATANYQGMTIVLDNDGKFASTNITTPSIKGRYFFKSSSSPIPLIIDVTSTIETRSSTPWKTFNWVWNVFK